MIDASEDGPMLARDLRKISSPNCAHCLDVPANPATCIGAYEGMEDETPACDVCCGHGNEDGYCKQLKE